MAPFLLSREAWKTRGRTQRFLGVPRVKFEKSYKTSWISTKFGYSNLDIAAIFMLTFCQKLVQKKGPCGKLNIFSPNNLMVMGFFETSKAPAPKACSAAIIHVSIYHDLMSIYAVSLEIELVDTCCYLECSWVFRQNLPRVISGIHRATQKSARLEC